MTLLLWRLFGKPFSPEASVLLSLLLNPKGPHEPGMSDSGPNMLAAMACFRNIGPQDTTSPSLHDCTTTGRNCHWVSVCHFKSGSLEVPRHVLDSGHPSAPYLLALPFLLVPQAFWYCHCHWIHWYVMLWYLWFDFDLPISSQRSAPIGKRDLPLHNPRNGPRQGLVGSHYGSRQRLASWPRLGQMDFKILA